MEVLPATQMSVLKDALTTKIVCLFRYKRITTWRKE